MKKLLHLAVDSLPSPSTVAYFWIQSQLLSSHSVSSSQHGRYFTRLSPFTLTWSLLSLTGSLLPNTTVWFHAIRCSHLVATLQKWWLQQLLTSGVSPVQCCGGSLQCSAHNSCFSTCFSHCYMSGGKPCSPFVGSLVGLLESLMLLRGNDLLVFCRHLDNFLCVRRGPWELSEKSRLELSACGWAELHPDIKYSWMRRV